MLGSEREAPLVAIADVARCTSSDCASGSASDQHLAPFPADDPPLCDSYAALVESADSAVDRLVVEWERREKAALERAAQIHDVFFATGLKRTLPAGITV